MDAHAALQQQEEATLRLDRFAGGAALAAAPPLGASPHAAPLHRDDGPLDVNKPLDDASDIPIQLLL